MTSPGLKGNRGVFFFRGDVGVSPCVAGVGGWGLMGSAGLQGKRGRGGGGRGAGRRCRVCSCRGAVGLPVFCFTVPAFRPPCLPACVLTLLCGVCVMSISFFFFPLFSRLLRLFGLLR